MSVEWFTNSFQEHSIAWLLLTTILGGIVGSVITLVFDELIRPRIAFHRELSRVYLRYRNPLLGAANSLERQINIIVRSRGSDWLSDEYYRLSTFYKFGTFLFWVNEIESNFGFLEMSSSKKTRMFVRRLYGPFGGISSIRRYQLAADTALPRDIARAIGEDMAHTDPVGGSRPIGFATFVRKYGQDAQFNRWFQRLEQLLNEMARAAAPAYLERLVVTAVQLKLLVRFLDPAGTYTGGDISYLDALAREELKELLKREIGGEC